LAADPELLVPWRKGGAWRMQPTVVTESKRNLNQIQLQLKVTGVSANALVLDKEPGTGFSPRFRPGLREDFTHSKKNGVSLVMDGMNAGGRATKWLHPPANGTVPIEF